MKHTFLPQYQKIKKFDDFWKNGSTKGFANQYIHAPFSKQYISTQPIRSFVDKIMHNILAHNLCTQLYTIYWLTIICNIIEYNLTQDIASQALATNWLTIIHNWHTTFNNILVHNYAHYIGTQLYTIYWYTAIHNLLAHI